MALELEPIRHALLHLHKTMIVVAREDLERLEGRLTPADLLKRLMEDPALSWLRQLSELIVRMDEWLDEPTAPDTAGAPEILAAAARGLLAPDPGGDDFARNYADLLHRSPDVVLAHAAVRRLVDR